MEKVLKWYGMPSRLLDLVMKIYNGATFKIKFDPQSFSEKFEQQRGIRQGSGLSPLLFVAVLNFAMTATELACRDLGLEISYKAFADDTAIEEGKVETLNLVFNQLESAVFFIGLRLNTKKCEIILIILHQPR